MSAVPKAEGNCELLSGWHRADTACRGLQASGAETGRTGGERLLG